LQTFSPFDLASIAWAFAALEKLDQPLMAAISKEALTHLDAFGNQDLTNLVWAFAKL